MKILTEYKLDPQEPMIYRPGDEMIKEMEKFVKDNSQTFCFNTNTESINLVNKFCEVLDFMSIKYERQDEFDGLVYLTLCKINI